MSNVITQVLDDEALKQLLIQAWRLGFNTSTERCNGEFPGGLEDDGQADIQELIQALQAASQESRKAMTAPYSYGLYLDAQPGDPEAASLGEAEERARFKSAQNNGIPVGVWDADSNIVSLYAGFEKFKPADCESTRHIESYGTQAVSKH